MVADDPVRLLEEAPFAPELWPEALEAVGRTYNARIMSLMREGPTGLELFASPSAENARSTYIREQWFDLDVRSQRGLRYSNEFSFMTDDVLLSKEEQQSQFYRDFATRFDVPHCIAWRFTYDNENYVWTFMRSGQSGPALQHEKDRLRPLVSRATTAAILSARAAKTKALGLVDGLMASGTAAIVLGDGGRVIGVTERAEALFSREFTVHAGRVFLADAEAARSMRKLEAALSPKCIETEIRGFGFDSQKGRIIALPSRLAPMAMEFFSRVRALLILKPLRLQVCRDAEALRIAYGLTRAESDVAIMIGNGATLHEIAEVRQVSIETVRSILKSILNKTGLRRQAELAAMVVSLVS